MAEDLQTIHGNVLDFDREPLSKDAEDSMTVGVLSVRLLEAGDSPRATRDALIRQISKELGDKPHLADKVRTHLQFFHDLAGKDGNVFLVDSEIPSDVKAVDRAIALLDEMTQGKEPYR